MIFLWAMTFAASAQDHFADIGTRAYDTRKDRLVEPQPPALPDIPLPAENDPTAAFRPVQPMSTAKELYTELAKVKASYRPFLQNLPPPVADTRKRIPLNTFQWREETPEDRNDFAGTLKGAGNWRSVTIPHYGPPLGRAVTYYYKEVQLQQADLADRQLFACFKGVDYKGSLFVNGSYCGSHEGFFAPFEINIRPYVHAGKNALLVKVENDFTTFGGADDRGNHIVGDKIYGTTGPGYDDPVLGWHQCPPGMGIYQDCWLETRSSVHLGDLFVRPQPDSSKTEPHPNNSTAEAWIEVNSCETYPANISLLISVYGQNFKDTVVGSLHYIPRTTYIPGVGDLAKPADWSVSTLKMQYGVNYLRVPLDMKNFRRWTPETPWLYQLQVSVVDSSGKITDTRIQQFGMRSFTMDTTSSPKGRLFLNGEMIRLRGANSMGFEQQDVIHGNKDQLIDDILLARICHINYLRFTQRPVQPEVYEICDQLGMLNQTDLPLFGALRRNQFAQAVKQAEEMERLVRSHPSTIMVTYINERFPNAEGSPQRSFNTADEYYRLFAALDQAVLLSNPERVIKAGDGDYDPPSPGLPDNHCYNTWYNGHGLSLGKLYKGYWQWVKPGWFYGCGEFGAEGLDPLSVMKKYYPPSWLPSTPQEDSNWNPGRISQSQTQRFHYQWYNTPHTVAGWIAASQDHQAWAAKFVAECFRRDPRMVSFAIHLFIDAWPAGWMKAIMDVDRQPKKAFFAYRNALEPLLVSLRSDRNQFFSGDTTAFEAWICNDLNAAPRGYTLHYQVEPAGDTLPSNRSHSTGKPILANRVDAHIPVNSSQFQGFLRIRTPVVKQRTSFVLRAALVNEKGESINQNEFAFEVFPVPEPVTKKIFVLGSARIAQLAQQAGYKVMKTLNDADMILIDDYKEYQRLQPVLDSLVNRGRKLLFIELPSGSYSIGGSPVTVEKTTMGNYYFVSPTTGHPIVRNFRPFDFNRWYDGATDRIEPLIANTLSAPGWSTILSSGNPNWVADKGPVMAAAERSSGKGVFRICEIELADRVRYDPTAALFFKNLIEQ
jgi:hypothetical protein